MFPDVHAANFSIMAEVLLTEHLFARFLPRRERYPLRLISTVLLCLLLAYLFPVFSDEVHVIVPYGTFMYLSLFCLAGLSLLACYQENGWSILFCAITGYTIHQLASALHDFVHHLLPAVPEIVPYLLSLSLTVSICYFVLSGSIMKEGTIRIDNKKMLILSAGVLLVDVVLGLVCMAFLFAGAPSHYLALIYFYNGLCCVFILSILFGLLSNRRLELEVAVMTQLLEEEKKQYEMSRNNIESINLKCHDLKHQIRRLRTGNTVVSSESLQEIEDAVGIYDAVARTGNDAMDVILTEKSLICERAGIHLTCIADGEQIGFISPADVYALFGNALDNAIEAVIQLPDPERRNVSLNVHTQGRLLSIHVENYFGGELLFEDDLPQTSKQDKANHGFGMKSMRLIAERYGGYLTTGTCGEIFHLNILIPVPSRG